MEAVESLGVVPGCGTSSCFIAFGCCCFRIFPHGWQLLESTKQLSHAVILSFAPLGLSMSPAESFLAWLRKSKHPLGPPMLFGTLWGYEEEMRWKCSSETQLQEMK